MKKGDLLWGGALAAVLAFLLFPVTHRLFIDFTSAHHYLSGFIKFGLLATMGELLAPRIVKGDWERPSGLHYRAIIWGCIGVLITFIFPFYAGGVKAGQASGLLPGGENTFLFAFFTGALMNLTFGPVFMIAHRFSDTYLDMRYEDDGQPISVERIARRIDWAGFYGFVLLKTIPLFWIPAHTLTFLLPPVYRVVVAALLSIVLGAILSFAKRKK